MSLAGCARAAGVDPDLPGLRLDERGNRNRVLVDAAGGRVWRFPRFAVDLPRLPADALRTRAAHDLGLPAPAVLGGRLLAPLGEAHVELRYLPGLAMDDERLRLDDLRAARLGHDLAGVLRRARRLPEPGWPLPAPAWVPLWERMAERVREQVLPRLPHRDRAAAEADLLRALAAGRAAPPGLVHGDLGGVNVRVDPATGTLTGIIDWDGAVPGDPAVDVLAVHASVDRRVWAAMLAADPELAGELARGQDYLPTWALQEVLWGLQHGDPALVADGLRRYGSTSEPATSSPSSTSMTGSGSSASASRTSRIASPGG